jgi:type II secretory pathway pseudopilin PulG
MSRQLRRSAFVLDRGVQWAIMVVMSVVAACVDAEVVIRRARALFGTSGGAEVPSGAAQLSDAAQRTSQARQRTSEMTGEGIPAYRDMVERAVPPLHTAAGSDTHLATHITSAVAVDQAGATRLDAIAANTRQLSAAAPGANTASQQRAILTALRGQLQQASQVVQTTQQQGNSTATAIRDLKYPKDTPGSSGDGIQALDDGQKKPAPPHGHDPRYWIDVTKIAEVPDGEMAPRGYVQIGPNMWYPFEDNQMSVHPPPDPVKYPLDFHDIQHFAPGSLGPTGTSEYAPGWFAPDPRHFYGPQPAWTPQAPVDIRDIVKVPEGEKAPWGFKEYAPGWWAPDVSHDGFPTRIPPRR